MVSEGGRDGGMEGVRERMKGPGNPYKLCNQNLFVGVIIFPGGRS